MHDAAFSITDISEAEMPAPPDFDAIKTRQRATWDSGDYHRIATRIQVVAELLIETLDLRANERVLDVATGSGNAAIAAARRSNPVVGVDYAPSLLERARVRTAAEELEIDFVEGDAEALPFGSAAFDVVTSVFGTMFAPNQDRTAAELLRVTKPGGRIGLVSHTPDGFIGQLLRTVGRHVAPPAGVRSPVQWGTEVRLEELFGHAAASLETTTRHYVFRYASPAAFVAEFRDYYGPTHKAFETLGAVGGPALERDLLELIDRFNQASDGTMVVPTEYLETVVVKR